MLEDFVRESRMVVLGFYVNDEKIKQRANEIIENKVAMTVAELGEETSLHDLKATKVSIHAVRARTIDAYLEMGTRYFKRYASMNWTIFLTPASKQRLENIKAEIAVLDEVIYEIQQEIRMNDQTSMSELGHYLFSKVRLERVLDKAESEMIHVIESPIFKERILPEVVNHFYEASKRRP